MGKDEFVPKILCFLCQWCGYSAADLAGTTRVQYPPSIRSIEVTCSGMVHPNWIVNSLLGGLDGVMIFGCHLGQCHYGAGNEIALARSQLVKETLWDLGIDEERFAIEWVSASEAEKFAQKVTEMTEKIRQLGPNTSSHGSLPGLEKPVYQQTIKEFIYNIDGKDYYWDGEIYNDHLSAQRAISKYLDLDFEAKLVPVKDKILIYTRREVHKFKKS